MPETLLFGIPLWQLEVSCFDTIADLRTFPAADNPNWTQRAIAQVFGQATVFDGQFLWYSWDPTSALADDGVSTIKPTQISGSGRWRLSAGFGSSFATALGS